MSNVILQGHESMRGSHTFFTQQTSLKNEKWVKQKGSQLGAIVDEEGVTPFCVSTIENTKMEN